jgi:hypothetical protein
MHGEWQGCYRLRVGEYRVIFRYIEDGLEILTVGHRSDVYKWHRPCSGGLKAGSPSVADLSGLTNRVRIVPLESSA